MVSASAGEADATVVAAGARAMTLGMTLGFGAPIILGRDPDLSGTEARRDAGKDATTSDFSSGFSACFDSCLATGVATRAGGGAASAIVTGMVRLDCVTVPSGAFARSVNS
jgi:hypothetical protein